VPLYARLYASESIVFDDTAPFVTQTYRSRAVIATENGAQSLTVPVVHDGGKVAMRDVRISEHGNWRHLHWNALVSAYRKSPFFDYYADDFAHFYEEGGGFLLDFNIRLHNVVGELLGLDNKAVITEKTAINTEKNNITDLRQIAEPKELTNGKYKSTVPYYQVFAQRNSFIPNLSIVDLLFNMGPEGLITLKDSATEPITVK
jgi:hypothetical protein